MDIRLNSTTSKSSVNQNMAINVDLEQTGQLLPVNDGNDVIDLEELYRKERAASNKVRIICTIRPVCSNVLFNRMTEVVRSEGSGSVEKLPDCTGSTTFTGETIVGKPADFGWNEYQAVRDTQLSNKCSGFKYLCGADIFNNHILRNKMFRKVCKNGKTSVETPDAQFNTIDDYMRNEDGEGIKVLYDPTTGKTPQLATGKKSFMYSDEDVYDFQHSVAKNLKEQNGWLGFINKANMPVYDIFPSDKHINRVINCKNGCDFIEMYPDSSLFSFAPKYNKFMNREEKNWNYCLTYPYSSTTTPLYTTTKIKTFSFMTTEGKMVACGFDDQVNGQTGLFGVYSIAKHGLNIGDKVNVYVNGDLYIAGGSVVSVGNDQYDEGYFFSVRHDGAPIYNTWVTAGFDDTWTKSHLVGDAMYDGKTYSVYYDGSNYFAFDGTYVYPASYNEAGDPPLTIPSGAKKSIVLSNGRAPLLFSSDENVPTITYAKTVGGQECSYYVQLMRRVPNWRGATSALTTASRTNETFLNDYIDNGHEFASSNMKLGFSKTIYGDDVAQITFDEDIDLTDLRDNLGRPLSEVYLTVIKNNKGYEKWYGSDATKWPSGSVPSGITARTFKEWLETPKATRFAEVKAAYGNNRYEKWRELQAFMGEVEASHCFGEVSCGYPLSYESMSESGSNRNNVLTISTDNSYGLPTGKNRIGAFKRDINYETHKVFYGDICCFSPYEFKEEHITDLCFRFNTAQRDNKTLKFLRDEISTGDDAWSSVTKHSYTTAEYTFCPEGYYYKAHYPIKIHGFSERVFRQAPKEFDIEEINIMSTTTASATTFDENYAEVGDLMYLHNYNTLQTWPIKVTAVKSNTEFFFSFTGSTFNAANPNDFKIERPDATIPSYAVMMKNNCQFVWREFVKNGCEGYTGTDELAFANGAYYAFPDLSFYLKRQDPHDLVWVYSNGAVYMNNRHVTDGQSKTADLQGIMYDAAKIDAVIDELNMKCN